MDFDGSCNGKRADSLKSIICNQNERVSHWVSERMGISDWSSCKSIGLEENGELVAGVVFDYYNKASICMHVAAVGSRWMNREYLWYSFHYPFNELKVKRITGLVPESNQAALNFDLNLGFKLETRLKDAHPDGDILVMKMMREDCRFINKRYWPRLKNG